MSRALLALAVAIVASAPVTARAEPAPPPPEMSAADVRTWLAFFDKLVVTVVRAERGSCERLATDVSAVIAANKGAIAVARRAHQDGKKLPVAAQYRMMDGVQKMVPAMQKCGLHDKVRAAFAKLDLTRRG